jgi:[ribosomal protein S5]-alanine N-acetyltransferase
VKLLPIKETLNENRDFSSDPACSETLEQCIDFYGKVGFEPPWICYYAEDNGRLVGSAAYKGKPLDGTIEIAYGTFDDVRGQGIGGRMCKELVAIALETDPSLRITARTLPEKNPSTRILEKNGFRLVGTVEDPEDGEVWEWEYVKIDT